MKKMLLLPFFWLCLSSLSAQSPDEDFINEIYQSIVPSNKAFFILADSSVKIFDKQFYAEDFDFKRDLNNLFSSGKIDSSSFYKLLQQALEVRNLKKWNCEKLLKAKCVNLDTVQKWTSGTINIVVKNTWTEKQKTAEIEKQQNEYYRKKKRYSPYYYFSQPVFTDNLQYAMIRLGFSCGNLCAKNSACVFKNENGKWVKIFEFDIRIS